MHRHRQICHRRDPAQIVDCDRARDLLATAVPVRLRDGPTVSRDGLGTRLSAAGIPNIEKHQRVAARVQTPKQFSLAILIVHGIVSLPQLPFRVPPPANAP